MTEIIKKHHIKLMVFLVFLGILGFFFYTTFYQETSLTGKTTFDTTEGKIKINAVLTIPELSVAGGFDNVELIGGSNSNFYAGDEQFYLGNSRNNNLKINNYTGRISFNDRKITEIKGNSPKILINGIVIVSRSKTTMSVHSEDSIDYNLLEINQGVEISKLNYNATGTIRVNDKNIFPVKNQEIILRNFNGKLKLENGNIELEGRIDSMKILGENEISVS